MDCLPRLLLHLPGSLGKEDTLNKEQKKEAVATLRDRFSNATAVVLTEYKGLTVEEISEARKTFRAENIEYRVVKNTLAKIASDETPVSAVRDHFEGPVGVAMGFDDPVAVAKNVLAVSKKNDNFKIRCGVFEGSLIQENELKKIALLPSRDVQLSMLAGVLTAPMSKLAAGFLATITRLGYAFEALKSKKEE